MNPYPKTIICPTFNENNESALRCAGVIAKSFGSRLLVLNVVDHVERTISSPGTTNYHIRPADPLNELDAPNLEGAMHERFELRGEPASGIRDFSLRMNADLVVLSNDVAFEEAIAFGPRTERIAGCLPCNVLVIKNSDCSQPDWSISVRERQHPDNDLEEEFPLSSWLLEHSDRNTKDVPSTAGKPR